MMRKVQVEDPGDSDFLPARSSTSSASAKRTACCARERKKPATASPLLLGITKASLQSDSFISRGFVPGDDQGAHRGALAGKRDDSSGSRRT
jgi:DNA-directed RNA polymerase subunit beta'